MYFEQRIVTPEQAQEWRDGAAKNRRIHPGKVKEYENDILSGHFTETPQGISFNRDGVLLDGNHRLQAIINTGIPTLLTIAHDVPDDAVFDRGIVRTTGESLYMRNQIDVIMSSTRVMSVVNTYLRAAAKNSRTITESVIAEFINKNQDQILKSINIAGTGSKNCICQRGPVEAAILGALLQGVPEESLYEFTKCVNSGFSQNGDADSAAIVLRNYILEKKATGRTGGRKNADELCMTTEMAIKDFMSHAPRKRKYQKLAHVYIHPEVRA